MSEYGLPTKRDDEGNLEPVDHEFEWGDQTVTLKLIPPTISQQEEYENLGEETGSDELLEILEEHLVEPDPTDYDLTAREMLCYVNGIVDYSVGEATGMAGDIRAELDARQDAGGN